MYMAPEWLEHSTIMVEFGDSIPYLALTGARKKKRAAGHVTD